MSKTQGEKKHLAAVARIGCIVCRMQQIETPAEIHHLRSGMGMAQRNTNYKVIPLCSLHHRLGDGSAACQHQIGFHKNPGEFQRRYGTEKFLAEVMAEVLIQVQELEMAY